MHCVVLLGQVVVHVECFFLDPEMFYWAFCAGFGVRTTDLILIESRPSISNKGQVT